MDNPTVWCAVHAKPFGKWFQETDHDGTQILVKQCWDAACGCSIEITLAVPDARASAVTARAPAQVALAL
jgi:hypothetical protein